MKNVCTNQPREVWQELTHTPFRSQCPKPLLQHGIHDYSCPAPTERSACTLYYKKLLGALTLSKGSMHALEGTCNPDSDLTAPHSWVRMSQTATPHLLSPKLSLQQGTSLADSLVCCSADSGLQL